MKQIRKWMAAVLLCLTVAAAVLPVSARQAQSANVVTYVPCGEEQVHTIHWLRGITPPTMPGQTVEGRVLGLRDADFKLIDGSGTILKPEDLPTPDDPNAEEYYVTEYLPGNGWYDINKMNETSGPDSQLCFAVAATNAMHWWMDQNRDHLDRYLERLDAAGDPLAERLRHVRQDSSAVGQNARSSRLYADLIYPAYSGGGGGWPDLPMDYFFNGYTPLREGGRNVPSRFQGPASGGGLFYPVFGKSILTDRKNGGRYDVLQETLKQQMDDGIAVVLGYSVLGNAAHAVTLWGAEYDEKDQLCALYVTDNNDSGAVSPDNRFGPEGTLGADAKLISMIRYKAYNAADPAGRLKITTFKDPRNRGSMINDRFLLTLAPEAWEHYERTGEPLYADGRAYLSPIYDQTDCRHEFGILASNGRITRSCFLCGYSDWVELRVRKPGPYVYQGERWEPYAMYSSLGSTYGFVPTVQYSNNRNAGTAAVTLSYQGYSTTLHFTIEKATQEAPQAPAAASVTASSVTLVELEGMEYRMDQGPWQTAPAFYGLQPGSTHRFSMRRAEQKNYLPSEASAPVSVTTEEGGLTVSMENGSVEAVLPPDLLSGSVTLAFASYTEEGRQLDLQLQSVDQPELGCTAAAQLQTAPGGRCTVLAMESQTGAPLLAHWEHAT